MPAVEDYLTLRRRLGFTLERAGRLLPEFVAYLERNDASRVSTELAVAWATLPAHAHPSWWSERLSIVRGFARYLSGFDPASEVPPVGIFSAHKPRVAPYVFSAEEITALTHAARRLQPDWRGATYETLIGLLVVTGLRLGEALRLDRPDIDLDQGLLLVGRGKLDQPRQLPLHQSTIAALRRYCTLRDRWWPHPATASFFVSARGARLGAHTVHDNFRALVTHIGLEGHGARRWPRPHDLRHSLAVHTLTTWHDAGADVEAKLPLLSTWLGHVDPSATYWYLQATPQLLRVVAQRLEPVLDRTFEDPS
jgi:integrase